jgi:hypothetical protein
MCGRIIWQPNFSQGRSACDVHTAYLGAVSGCCGVRSGLVGAAGRGQGRRPQNHSVQPNHHSMQPEHFDSYVIASFVAAMSFPVYDTAAARCPQGLYDIMQVRYHADFYDFIHLPHLRCRACRGIGLRRTMRRGGKHSAHVHSHTRYHTTTRWPTQHSSVVWYRVGHLLEPCGAVLAIS